MPATTTPQLTLDQQRERIESVKSLAAQAQGLLDAGWSQWFNRREASQETHNAANLAMQTINQLERSLALDLAGVLRTIEEKRQA